MIFFGMNALVVFASIEIDPQLCGRLCLMLAHSVWQVGLLALVATLLVRFQKRENPELGYAVYVAALLVGLAVLPITYSLVQIDPQVLEVSRASATEIPTIMPNVQPQVEQTAQLTAPIAVERSESQPSAVPVAISQESQAESSLLRFAPWLAGCYAVGVIVMLLRLGQGIWKSYKLARDAKPVGDGSLNQAFQKTLQAWSLRVIPVLAQAQEIIVPQVVGLLRPTILLPTSAICGLSPAELEMILAHELAHVRRYDMWVNLLQRLAESILFFNPALWYLSRRVSTYREYCCDEQTCRSEANSTEAVRLRYAKALLHVVELSGKGTSPEIAALAATGASPSELRRRVARLFGEPLREPIGLSRNAVLSVIAGIVLVIAGPAAWQNAAESKPEATEVLEEKSPISKVEVVAIGTHDEEPQRWWDAEGEPLAWIPFEWKGANNVSSSERVWRRIVFKINALPENSDVNWTIQGGGSAGDAEITFKGVQDAKGYFTRYFGLAENRDTFGLRVGVAAGSWKTIVKAPKRLQATGRGDKSIVLSETHSTTEGTVVVVSHNYFDQAFRIVAIDKQGIEHSSTRAGMVSAGGIYQSSPTFPGLLPTEIDHFEFQVRDYEWTEIKDLPVEPGAIPPRADQAVDSSLQDKPNEVGSARIATLKELVELYEADYKRLETLYKVGVVGSEKAQAQLQLHVARSDLANAQGKLNERVEQLSIAVAVAEELVEVQQHKYDTGNVTLDVLLAAKFKRASLKILLAEAEAVAKRTTAGGENTRSATTQLATPRRIRVKVADAGGKPLVGVKVFRNHAYYEIEGERSQFENDTYYTDASGNAVIPLSGRTRILRIWAGKQGFVPQFANWEKESQTDGDQIPAKFEFSLNRGTRISGMVTNVAGIPIEGVRVEVKDATASRFSRDTLKPQPGERPVRDGHLAYGAGAVRTNAEGFWELDNIPSDEELIFDEVDAKLGEKVPLRLRFTHPDYETIDGIDKWQSVWNPPLTQLRDGTARTVMKWIDRDSPGRVNAVRLEQGEQYRNADFSGRHFKGQEIIVWSDNMLAGANLTDSTWEDMLIPGMGRLIDEADLTGAKLINVQLSGRSSGMQKTDFTRARLESANLSGGVSAFQKSIFAEASITNSSLEGGGASFQMASFENAKLHSSRLRGGGPAFQKANFNGASLYRTTITCNSPTAFQGVSLNDTEFVESDLSTIDAQALASCEFDKATPPAFDAKTKFPEGFDPEEEGWKLIE